MTHFLTDKEKSEVDELRRGDIILVAGRAIILGDVLWHECGPCEFISTDSNLTHIKPDWDSHADWVKIALHPFENAVNEAVKRYEENTAHCNWVKENNEHWGKLWLAS